MAIWDIFYFGKIQPILISQFTKLHSKSLYGAKYALILVEPKEGNRGTFSKNECVYLFVFVVLWVVHLNNLIWPRIKSVQSFSFVYKETKVNTFQNTM